MSQIEQVPKRTGRPPEYGPVVAVDIDGKVLMWCQGALTGPGALRGAATVAGVVGERVRLVSRGTLVAAALPDSEPASDWEWVGIAAALVAASPGRARLVEAPQAVWDFVRSEGGGCMDEVPDPELDVAEETGSQIERVD